MTFGDFLSLWPLAALIALAVFFIRAGSRRPHGIRGNGDYAKDGARGHRRGDFGGSDGGGGGGD